VFNTPDKHLDGVRIIDFGKEAKIATSHPRENKLTEISVFRSMNNDICERIKNDNTLHKEITDRVKKETN
jgi:hypothetical protein